jgi:hypothetical protein
MTPDIAAFDPIFWFFHCNWERLWWAWQMREQATTLAAFRQTLENADTDWIDTPPFDELKPFQETTMSSLQARTISTATQNITQKVTAKSRRFRPDKSNRSTACRSVPAAAKDAILPPEFLAADDQMVLRGGRAMSRSWTGRFRPTKVALLRRFAMYYCTRKSLRLRYRS